MVEARINTEIPNPLGVPPHYANGASELGCKYLSMLGIHNGLDGDLFTAAQKHYNFLENNAYLFDLCKYLWRLGEKGPAIDDAIKAVRYGKQYLARNYFFYIGEVQAIIEMLENDFNLRE